MTKEEQIRKEWIKEGLVESEFEFADPDGFLHISKLEKVRRSLLFDEKEFEVKEGRWFRPKSLSGLENNNGWIKIESEKDLPIRDEPTNDGDVQMYSSGIYSSTMVWCEKSPTNWHGIQVQFRMGNINYYRPIEKTQPPLY